MSHTGTILIDRGDPPPCLKSQSQCRGCPGWRPMLQAARNQPAWLGRPFKCRVTGLTLKVEVIHASAP